MGWGESPDFSAMLVQDWIRRLTPVGGWGNILSPLTLRPWPGDSSERLGEVSFLDTESISYVTHGLCKDKAAVSFMPTPSLGDPSHQWPVSYKAIRGHVTWGNQ